MTDKIEALLKSAEPFIAACKILDALTAIGKRIPDDAGLRDHLPGVWPTMGELRKLKSALEDVR